MPPISLILTFLSSVIHVGWNVLAKKNQPSAPLFLAGALVGSLCPLPILIYHLQKVPMILADLWIFLLISGFATIFYYRSLATAYNASNLSMAYPLLRSSPIFIVGIMFLLGKGHEISWQCLVGIMLVIIGCFFLPMSNFRDFRKSNYISRTFLAALVAATATAIYSISDDHSLRLLNSGKYGSLSNGEVSLIYSSLWGISSCLWQGIGIIIRKAERRVFLEIVQTKKKTSIFLGLGINLGYLLTLTAMTYSQNVAYVIAFRQVNLPLGALIGVLVLKDAFPLPKATGLLILFIGLTLVATG